MEDYSLQSELVLRDFAMSLLINDLLQETQPHDLATKRAFLLVQNLVSSLFLLLNVADTRIK